MIFHPQQIEFTENLVLPLFPESFSRPLQKVDRDTEGSFKKHEIPVSADHVEILKSSKLNMASVVLLA